MTLTEVHSPRRRFGKAGDRLLEVRGLQTSFHTRDGVVRAVTGVDFHVDRGEVMGLVGESGCGKSVTSLSIMRLIAPPGRVEAGEVVFDGQNLLKLRDREMRRIRGERISMFRAARRLRLPSRRFARLASMTPTAASMNIPIRCQAACANA